MKTTLDNRDSHLGVLYELGDGSSDRLGILREWSPVREATEGEVAMLVGRPVNGIKRDEGLSLMKRVIPASFRSREGPSLLRSRMTPARAMTPTGRRTKGKAGPTVRLGREGMTYATPWNHNGQMR